MANLSVTGLENQLLDQVFQKRNSANGSLSQRQRTLVQYAFRDFVNYFLKLDRQAQSAIQQANPTLPQNTVLSTTGLHLDIRMEAYDTNKIQAQGQPVSVHKQEDINGAATCIEVYTPETDANGATTYHVTAIKLAVSLNQVAQNPEPGNSTQVTQVSNTTGSGSSGDGLQDFLNRSPQSGSAGVEFWHYHNDDAMELLEEEERLQDWRDEQHLQELIAAAYEILSYLQSMKIKAAFDMTEEEKETMLNALQNDPAEVAQKVLQQFIKKKRLELEMLRKELKDRQEATEHAHQINHLQAQFERLLNFYDHAQKLLETQKLDRGHLQDLLNTLPTLSSTAA